MTMRDDWWVKPLSIFAYFIGPILPFLIEIVISLQPVTAAHLFATYLLIHEFMVAREIEYHRPYSPSVKFMAHVEELFDGCLIRIYWLIKYTFLFLFLPIVINVNGNVHWFFRYFIIVCIMLIVSDTYRIIDILRQTIAGKRGVLYVSPLAPLVASYISFIFSFTILHYALYSENNELYSGRFSSVITVDFLYFNVVTFTTLGYGDITPTHWATRLIVSGENIISYILFAFTIAAVMNFVQKANSDQEKSTPHDHNEDQRNET